MVFKEKSLMIKPSTFLTLNYAIMCKHFLHKTSTTYCHRNVIHIQQFSKFREKAIINCNITKGKKTFHIQVTSKTHLFNIISVYDNYQAIHEY